MSRNPHKTSEQTVRDFHFYQMLMEEVQAISKTVLALSNGKDLPALNHAVLYRGELIKTLQTARVEQFSEEEKEWLIEQIKACEEDDSQVHQQMNAFLKYNEKQLGQLQQSKKTLHQYHLGEGFEENNIYSQHS